MSRRRCVVELHLAHDTGGWWAHCSDCHWSAAADSMEDIKRLTAGGHYLPFRLDLCVDNLPAANTSTEVETRIAWAVTIQ